MTTLAEIKKLTMEGSYDDPEKVGEIIKAFINIPMREIFSCGGMVRRDLFGTLTTFYELDKDLIDEFTYLEVICLIDNMMYMRECGKNEQYDRDTIEGLKYFLVDHLKKLLQEAGKHNLLIKRFLGIDAKTMFDHFENRYEDDEAKRMYRDLVRTQEEMLAFFFGGEVSATGGKWNDPGTTRIGNIGSVLKGTSDAGNRTWRRWNSLNNYRSMIVDASHIDARLLLEGFSVGYRERMNVDELLEKYLPPEYFDPIDTDDDDIFDIPGPDDEISDKNN